MKRFLIFILAFSLASCAYQARTYDKKSAPLSMAPTVSKVSGRLDVPEKLVYVVNWIGIPSGYITLEAKEITKVDGRDAYHLVAEALPNSFFKFFYNVKYIVHSYLDTETLKPLRFHKQRILNGKVSDERIEFLYLQNKIIWSYFNPADKKELKMPENPQDLLSSLYYLRLQDLTLGKTYSSTVVYNGHFWPLEVICNSIVDIEITSVGAFKTVVVIPSSGLTKYITGARGLETFISLDAKRLPVLFRMPTKIGYLSGVLIKSADPDGKL